LARTFLLLAIFAISKRPPDNIPDILGPDLAASPHLQIRNTARHHNHRALRWTAIHPASYPLICIARREDEYQGRPVSGLGLVHTWTNIDKAAVAQINQRNGPNVICLRRARPRELARSANGRMLAVVCPADEKRNGNERDLSLSLSLSFSLSLSKRCEECDEFFMLIMEEWLKRKAS